MEPGTYTLLLELERPASIEFGAAGTRDLDAGYYAYTGSAFGPGGLSRVSRHQRVAAGENDTRHWHIDYLLGHRAVEYLDWWDSPGRNAECEIASSLIGDPIPGLGATDCGCSSHLRYHPEREPLEAAIATAHH